MDKMIEQKMMVVSPSGRDNIGKPRVIRSVRDWVTRHPKLMVASVFLFAGGMLAPINKAEAAEYSSFETLSTVVDKALDVKKFSNSNNAGKKRIVQKEVRQRTGVRLDKITKLLGR